jgi:hypothetical protein
MAKANFPKEMIAYYRKCWWLVENEKVSAWDYQFFLSFVGKQVAVAPNINLMTNIGYLVGGTHGNRDFHSPWMVESENMEFPLVHPLEIEANQEADLFFLRSSLAHMLGGINFWKWKLNPKRLFRRLISKSKLGSKNEVSGKYQTERCSMTTCTVTFFRLGKNYGQFLQAFALQKRLGKQNTLLNISCSENYYVGRLRRIAPFFWKIIARYRIIKDPFQEIRKLRKTKLFIGSQKLSSDFSKIGTFVVGSDQIWNPIMPPVIENPNYYFLAFAPPTARRISYAASLGMSKWPKDFAQKVLPELRKFHAISVREESGAEYLRSLGLNAVCVCDPTILHTGDFYRKEFYKISMDKRASEPFTFIYRICEEILDKDKLTLNPNNKKIVWQDMRKKKRIPVAEWLWNIDHADLVVTDSFHAVVFCMLFHTPFKVVLHQGAVKGMNERFSTLLGKAGLPLASNPSEIDWASVDTKLAEWREYSKNWLMDALEGTA